MRGLSSANRTRIQAVAVSVAALTIVGAYARTTASATPSGATSLAVGKEIDLRFEESGASVGTNYPVSHAFINSGTLVVGTNVTINPVLLNSGTLKAGAGLSTGLSLDTPPPITTAGATPQSGIVSVLNKPKTTEHLSPGTQPFSFGADFQIDPASSIPGSHDNGDNLIQRGLFNAPSQYKIQVDNLIPTCYLRQKGKTAIHSDANVAINTADWYRATCTVTTTATQTTVSLAVFDLTTSTPVPTTPHTGALLNMDMPATMVKTPLSIGGKLSAANAVVADSTDQFNGLVDNAFLDLP